MPYRLPETKGRMEALKQKLGTHKTAAQKESTLCHTVSTFTISNLKNILMMNKWHLLEN